MQNLSDEERKDIEDLVSGLKPDSIEGEEAKAEIPLSGPNGNSDSDVVEIVKDKDDVDGFVEDPEVTAGDLLKVVSLQNDRLGILNKKVDVLTRLVELILRANLEDVE